MFGGKGSQKKTDLQDARRLFPPVRHQEVHAISACRHDSFISDPRVISLHYSLSKVDNAFFVRMQPEISVQAKRSDARTFHPQDEATVPS